MSNSIQSLYNWYRNTLRNPKYRWWIVLGTIAYLVSPFDIAPDFIPIIGQIDDVAVVTLLVAEISQMLIEYTKTRQNVTEGTPPAGDETVDVDAATIK